MNIYGFSFGCEK